MNINKIGFIASVSLAVMTPTAKSVHLDNPNLLADPSVEGTLEVTGTPPFTGGWEGFNSGPAATAAFTGTMPRTGAQSLEMTITAAGSQFAGAFQDVTLDPSYAGRMAWLSGWHALSGDSGGSEYRIEWRDAVGDEISRNQLVVSPGGAYEEFIVSGTVPVGAESARLVYAIQSFGGALNQTVYADDFNFNIEGVPEPGSALLIGLGGLALLRRRRRKE